eukprot:TRINITY_DN5183_c0_g1_i1.p1 TRINITY_DN5183_c0_g1~~TRINITY_DN5183_c0_g1_i1.p1  ORF type:complete len:50 (-),score=9.91 TRINITY_DN5183_c0_g1_i1:167-316(-)
MGFEKVLIGSIQGAREKSMMFVRRMVDVMKGAYAGDESKKMTEWVCWGF